MSNPLTLHSLKIKNALKSTVVDNTRHLSLVKKKPFTPTEPDPSVQMAKISIDLIVCFLQNRCQSILLAENLNSVINLF